MLPQMMPLPWLFIFFFIFFFLYSVFISFQMELFSCNPFFKPLNTSVCNLPW